LVPPNVQQWPKGLVLRENGEGEVAI
jgi:hypothetical protein